MLLCVTACHQIGLVCACMCTVGSPHKKNEQNFKYCDLSAQNDQDGKELFGPMFHRKDENSSAPYMSKLVLQSRVNFLWNICKNVLEIQMFHKKLKIHKIHPKNVSKRFLMSFVELQFLVEHL